MSNIIREYDGKANDVETIIRLKPWVTDAIMEELGREGITASSCKFEWSYDAEKELFNYRVYALA